PIPDVGNGDDLEVELRADFPERGEQGLAEPVGEADDPDAHAVVGAEDPRVARRGQRGGGHLQELAAAHLPLPGHLPSSGQECGRARPAADSPASAPRMWANDCFIPGSGSSGAISYSRLT